LVIGTDVSKYPLRSSGECTQGAGAVALLISEAPRLLELDGGSMGTATRDERDFFRPNWTHNAVVDGKYSIDVYLDLIEAAWQHRAQRLAATGGDQSRERYEDFDHFLFHTPFPRMAEYAAGRIFGLLWLADPQRRAALEAEGVSASLPRREMEKRLRATDLFKRELIRKVEPSLTLSRRIGNVYSASLYLSLASLVVSREVEDLAGRRALFFSYGSGASAKVFSGRFGGAYRQAHSGPDILSELRQANEGGRRVALSLEQYERLHDFREYRADLPEAVVDRLRGGEALDSADRAAILRALDHENVRVVDLPASLVAPRGEFALCRISKGEQPGVNDVGYRYYDWIGG
jgi:hydroxymethylglutaryl-CoA synthase